MCSHIAFGSIRTEPVFMIIEQCTALATSLALDQQCAVKNLDYRELERAAACEQQV